MNIYEKLNYFLETQTLIDKDYLVEYFNYSRKDKCLAGYVTRMEFATGDFIARYKSKDKTILFNYDKIANTAGFTTNQMSLFMLDCIDHELCHAYQDTLLTDQKFYHKYPSIYRTLIEENYIIANYPKLYNQNHHLFFVEYHSYINSKLSVLNFLIDCNVDNNDLINYNKEVALYIKNFYEFCSPIKNSLELRSIAEVDKTAVMETLNPELKFKYQIACLKEDKYILNEFENLQYGQDLEQYKLREIRKIYDGDIKTLDIKKHFKRQV